MLEDNGNILRLFTECRNSTCAWWLLPILYSTLRWQSVQVKRAREQQTVPLRLQKSGGVSNPTAGSRLSPGFCIFWHICRSPSRPGWCWIRFYTSAEWKTAFIRPPPSCYRIYIHTCSAHYTHKELYSERCSGSETPWIPDSPATPRPGERSSPARWVEPFPVSAGSTTALSSYTRGSP